MPPTSDIPLIQMAIETVTKAGFVVLDKDSPMEYAVSWDDRIITTTQQKQRAITMADEQAASQPGRWVAKQRPCGPWEDVEK